MIIQHFTDEEANRGPHKPAEATPLSISNFNRDGKRTDIYWPPTILAGPRLEFLHTLPYHTLEQPQGRIFFLLKEAQVTQLEVVELGFRVQFFWTLNSCRFYYSLPMDIFAPNRQRRLLVTSPSTRYLTACGDFVWPRTSVIKSLLSCFQPFHSASQQVGLAKTPTIVQQLLCPHYAISWTVDTPRMLGSLCFHCYCFLRASTSQILLWFGDISREHFSLPCLPKVSSV